MLHFKEYFLFSIKIFSIQKLIATFSLSVFDKFEFEHLLDEYCSKIGAGTAFFLDYKTNFKDNNSLGRQISFFMELNLFNILVQNLSLRINFRENSNSLDYFELYIKFCIKIILPLIDLMIKDQIRSDHLNMFFVGLYSILTIQRYLIHYIEKTVY